MLEKLATSVISHTRILDFGCHTEFWVVTLDRGDALLEPSQSRRAVISRSRSGREIVSFDTSLSPLCGVTTEFCVTVYNEKALNPVQTWLPGFSSMYHYTTFDMVSDFVLFLHIHLYQHLVVFLTDQQQFAHIPSAFW